MIVRHLLKTSQLGLLLIITLLVTACNPDFSAMADRRVEVARKNDGLIKVVAIQTRENSSYIKGVLLAEKEINARPEKLISRPLKVQVENDGENFEDTKHTIRRIVSDPRVTAVLGHRASSIAVPASVIYELSNVIFLPSFSTAQSLTAHNFKYVFRMLPSSSVMAEQMASAAVTLGYKKIALLYGRDDLSRELTFLFENAANENHIDIVNRSSFFEKEVNYRPIISQLSDIDFDAIFMSSGATSAGRMTKQLREMGITQPILGSDSLNNQKFVEAAGPAAENSIAPALYSAETNTAINRRFKAAYKKQYQTLPDANAAQGYDSLMLLADAISKTNSTLPSVLTSTLHYMPAWVGITGLHSFNEYGEMYGKKYLFVARKNDEWQYLPALHAPYLLSRFVKYKKDTLGQNYKITDYTSIFKTRMHVDDRHTYLIDLAHEILQFKNIGLIFEDTEDGRKASGYDIIKSVADYKKFNIIPCKISFSILTMKQIKQKMIACYGKLPLQADAIYVSPQKNGLDSKFIQVLNKNLLFFKTPTISSNTPEIDPSITISIDKRKDVASRNLDQMAVFNNLLSGLKVHEFSEQLKSLPGITVNIEHIQKYGLSEQAIIQLSPDSFTSYNDTPQEEGREQ